MSDTPLRQKLLSILELADIKVEKFWEARNGYWPDGYVSEIINSPWIVAKTRYGIIYFGWRKRVISFDWSDTYVRGIVTEDNVTKGLCMVHAWDYNTAVEYMSAWKSIAEEKKLDVFEEWFGNYISMYKVSSDPAVKRAMRAAWEHARSLNVD